MAAVMTGMPTFGSRAQSVGTLQLDDLQPGRLERLERPELALGAFDLRPVAHDDRHVARLEAEAADGFFAQRLALRVLLRADIAAAELGGDFVDAARSGTSS